MKKSTAELKVLVTARGSRLMDLPGVGPVVAARTLADVGDIARFADPQPVRVLDRHRTPGCLIGRADPAPGCPAPGTGG
jgi:transposase